MTTPHQEDWLPVVGWEGLYEVSSLGRVRSLSRRDRLGRRVIGRFLKPMHDTFGYPTVALSRGAAKRRCIHRLVAEAFHADTWFDGAVVCHNDGDPTNNHVSNLRWGTQSDNCRDTVKHGNNHCASRTECPQGHKYTPENTMMRRTGGRNCRECRRLSSKAANPVQRRLRKTRTMPERAHGTYGGYSNWDCRCDRCKHANTAYRRSLREARRLREAS